MTIPIILLRVSYWSAAVADFGIAAIMLMPARMGTMEVVYPMVLASAIAFSWGVMLLFADRKPLERRWMLIPTMLVIALLTCTRIYYSFTGTIEFSWFYPLLGTGLIILLAFSYSLGNKHASETLKGV
jgi:hypothetical protein